ncbi:MAG: hypothetical protein L6Q66_06540 [Bacteroidia bacterium]|nr:hypothetical protein [Bacteroidia bacterium]
MLKNLSYKQKNKLLLVAGTLLVMGTYVFGIKKTLITYNDYKSNMEKLTLAENAPVMLQKVKEELDQMNAKLGQNDSRSKSEVLIEFVTRYCEENGAVLKEFPKVAESMKDDLLIESNVFTVAGDFNTLLSLIYQLEQKVNVGKVVSVNYQVQKDLKTKEPILIAKVFVQNIKKNS